MVCGVSVSGCSGKSPKGSGCVDRAVASAPAPAPPGRPSSRVGPAPTHGGDPGPSAAGSLPKLRLGPPCRVQAPPGAATLCPGGPSWCRLISLPLADGQAVPRRVVREERRRRASPACPGDPACRQVSAAYSERPALGHPHPLPPDIEPAVLLGTPRSLETCLTQCPFAPNLAHVVDFSLVGAVFGSPLERCLFPRRRGLTVPDGPAVAFSFSEHLLFLAF